MSFTSPIVCEKNNNCPVFFVILLTEGEIMDFLRAHQLDIMLYMSGICGVLAVMTLMPKFMSRRRRSILALMEFSSMLLLIFDRIAYLHRGDISEAGGTLVRVSNGLVFFLTLLIPVLVSHFLQDLYRTEGGLEKAPRRLILCDVLFVVGTVLIIVSQFTNIYYIIDEQNIYRRTSGFIFSYIIPFLIVLIQESVIIQYRKRLRRGFVIVLSVSLWLPFLVAIVQFFVYGLSLTNMAITIVGIVLYIYTLCSLGEKVEASRVREIQFYKKAQKREATLFEETTEALATAIDAKDKYTHGHSTRVAAISRLIAQEAGMSEEECNQVYFSALLHDVGKIGIKDEIINKPGKLTDEEFEHIKLHTVLGYQILSNIRHFSYLSIGAHYHHERYDGRGYPEGLSGEEIPVIARIIAVADAYDAMVSNRSYRDALEKQKVRDEIANGIGKQFDYQYAAIMLQLIDTGKV